jgi:hypothetical protein
MQLCALHMLCNHHHITHLSQSINAIGPAPHWSGRKDTCSAHPNRIADRVLRYLLCCRVMQATAAALVLLLTCRIKQRASRWPWNCSRKQVTLVQCSVVSGACRLLLHVTAAWWEYWASKVLLCVRQQTQKSCGVCLVPYVMW